jgi:hypothetical protein
MGALRGYQTIRVNEVQHTHLPLPFGYRPLLSEENRPEPFLARGRGRFDRFPCLAEETASVVDSLKHEAIPQAILGLSSLAIPKHVSKENSA